MSSPTPSPVRPSHTPARSNSTHAYAIVTTSTALLSRSNTTNAAFPRHSFSPSPLPKYSSTPSHRHEYRHRHAKSMTSLVDPPALPSPPLSRKKVKPYQHGATTDPEGLSDSGSEYYSEREAPVSVKNVQDNPKTWDTTKLATYLDTKGAFAIADWVASDRITGRAFIRFSPSYFLPPSAEHLSAEDQEVLFAHAKELRVMNLKNSISDVDFDDDGVDLSHSLSAGRVKGMVEAFEQGALPTRARTISNSSSVTDPSDAEVKSPRRRPAVPLWDFDEDNFASSSEIESEHEHETNAYSVEQRAESPVADYEAPLTPALEEKNEEVLVVAPPSQVEEEEPSIEDLLNSPEYEEAQFPMASSWGAKAWEQDMGATARRVPNVSSDAKESGLTSMTRAFSPVEETVPVPEMPSVDAIAEPEVPSKEVTEVQPTVDEIPLMEIIDEPQVRTEEEEEHAPSPRRVEFVEEPQIEILPAETHSSRESSSTTLDESSHLLDEPPVLKEIKEMDDEHDELKARLAILEARIKELESQRSSPEPPNTEDQLTAPDSGGMPKDLPQYVLMAGVGVCAIIGRAVFRRMVGSK